MWGLIELYEATFKVFYLKKAIQFADYMIDHFWDKEDGGFYSTSDESEHILIRHKPFHDGVTPSGASVAMLNLLRLSRLTGITVYEEKALKLSQVFSNRVRQVPSSHTFLLTALDFALGPSLEIVVVGVCARKDLGNMIEPLKRGFMPNNVVVFRPDEASPEIAVVSPFTRDMTGMGGKATAYVCRNFTCSLPTTDVNIMLEQLTEQQDTTIP